MHLACPQCLKRTDIPFPMTDPAGLACGCMTFKMRPTRAFSDQEPPDCVCSIADKYRAMREGTAPINSMIPDIGCMQCGEDGYTPGTRIS